MSPCLQRNIHMSQYNTKIYYGMYRDGQIANNNATASVEMPAIEVIFDALWVTCPNNTLIIIRPSIL